MNSFSTSLKSKYRFDTSCTQKRHWLKKKKGKDFPHLHGKPSVGKAYPSSGCSLTSRSETHSRPAGVDGRVTDSLPKSMCIASVTPLHRCPPVAAHVPCIEHESLHGFAGGDHDDDDDDDDDFRWPITRLRAGPDARRLSPSDAHWLSGFHAYSCQKLLCRKVLKFLFLQNLGGVNELLKPTNSSNFTYVVG